MIPQKGVANMASKDKHLLTDEAFDELMKTAMLDVFEEEMASLPSEQEIKAMHPISERHKKRMVKLLAPNKPSLFERKRTWSVATAMTVLLFTIVLMPIWSFSPFPRGATNSHWSALAVAEGHRLLHDNLEELIEYSPYIVSARVIDVTRDRLIGGDTIRRFLDVNIYHFEVTQVFKGNLDSRHIEVVQANQSMSEFSVFNPYRERKYSLFEVVLKRFASTSVNPSMLYRNLDYIVSDISVGDELVMFLDNFHSIEYLRVFARMEFESNQRTRWSSDLFVLVNSIQALFVSTDKDSTVFHSLNRYGLSKLTLDDLLGIY